MDKTLSIIIVNWNSGNLLKDCIDSVLNSSFSNFEIIIVDNASFDNSLLILPKNEKIKIIKNHTNLGFGVACNMGVSLASSDFILFLNPDTKVFNETIKNSLIFFVNNKDIRVLGCKQIDENGNIQKSCARHPILKNYIMDILGLTKLFPHYFQPPTIMFDWDHKTSRFINHVSGGYFMIRKKTFSEFNGFDEKFFVYLEDLDLTKRIRDKYGESIFYNADIFLYHKENGTTDQVKDKRLFYSLNSRLKYAKKHFKQLDYLILKFSTLFIEPITRIFFFALKFDFISINQTIKGYKLLYKEIFN